MRFGKAGFKIVDVFRKTDMLGVYPGLLESQWLSPEELESLQFKKLKELLIHAGKNVEFYRQKFKEYNFDPNEIKSINDLKVLPVITKDDIRQNFEKF